MSEIPKWIRNLGQERDNIVGALHFPKFTPIAVQMRDTKKLGPKQTLEWIEDPNSPITLQQADELYAKGLIEKCQRHFDDRIECVVKTRKVVKLARVRR